MTHLRRYLGLAVVMMAFGAPLVASAQSIYKCPLRGGGYEYTDTPCTGPGGKVVHKATSGEIAAKVNADDRQAMLSLLRIGAVQEAKHYAIAHHQEALYNSIVASLIQEQAAAEQRRKQQAEIAQQQRAQAVIDKMNRLSAENQELHQQVNEQEQELELQRQSAAVARQRASAAQAAAISARNAAMRAQQDAATPKFNPDTGQWCQEIGDVVQCN